MELKVKEVSAAQEKSVQELEGELLEKHEEKLENESAGEVVKEDANEKVEDTTPPELKEEDVLSYIGKRYGKEINSFDDLMTEREESEELPDDVAAYFKFKKETGRSIDEFVELQKDYDTVEPDSLLKKYFSLTEKGLDSDDIDTLMEEYLFDEDIDDESDIKKIKLKKKKAIAKAKNYFTDMQEKYKQPIESIEPVNSNVPDEEYESYKQYVADAKTQKEELSRKREWYLEKLNNVFNPEFKGFEFNVGESTVSYAPSGYSELNKIHADPSNWTAKFIDENGMLKDAEGYHKSLAVAMNPEKFAQFFYEQGKSEATEDVMRKTKNINMSDRKTPEVTRKGGTQYKSLNTDSGRGLKIRSKKS